MLRPDMPPKCGWRDWSSKALNSINPSNSVRRFSFDSISKGRNCTIPDGAGTLHEPNKTSRRLVRIKLRKEWRFTKYSMNYHGIYRRSAQGCAAKVKAELERIVFNAGWSIGVRTLFDDRRWSPVKELDRNLTPIYGRVYRQLVDRQRLML
jgi:hypothetical protein